MKDLHARIFILEWQKAEKEQRMKELQNRKKVLIENFCTGYISLLLFFSKRQHGLDIQGFPWRKTTVCPTPFSLICVDNRQLVKINTWATFYCDNAVLNFAVGLKSWSRKKTAIALDRTWSPGDENKGERGLIKVSFFVCSGTVINVARRNTF